MRKRDVKEISNKQKLEFVTLLSLSLDLWTNSYMNLNKLALYLMHNEFICFPLLPVLVMSLSFTQDLRLCTCRV